MKAASVGLLRLLAPFAVLVVVLWLLIHMDRIRPTLPVLACSFLAIATPMIIIMIRHQIRRTRVAMIELFAQSFGFLHRAPQGGDKPPGGGSDNVSFEFVRGKYFADLFLDPKEPQVLSRIPMFAMSVSSDWMLLLCSLPYMLLTCFGMYLVFLPAQVALGLGTDVAWFEPSLLLLGGAPTDILGDKPALAAYHANALTVAALATDCTRSTKTRTALGLGTAPAPLTEAATLDRLARVILDDLHVLRLRQVWAQIRDKFAETALPHESFRNHGPAVKQLDAA